jgi:hypothetical protein
MQNGTRRNNMTRGVRVHVGLQPIGLHLQMRATANALADLHPLASTPARVTLWVFSSTYRRLIRRKRHWNNAYFDSTSIRRISPFFAASMYNASAVSTSSFAISASSLCGVKRPPWGKLRPLTRHEVTEWT